MFLQRTIKYRVQKYRFMHDDSCVFLNFRNLFSQEKQLVIQKIPIIMQKLLHSFIITNSQQFMNIWLISTLVTLLLSSYFYHQADEILEEIEDFIDGDEDDDDQAEIQKNVQQGKIQMPVISNCLTGKLQNNVSGTTFCEYTVEQNKVQVKQAKPLGLKGKYAKNTNQIKTTPKTQQSSKKNHVPQNSNASRNDNQKIPVKQASHSSSQQPVITKTKKKSQEKKVDKHSKKSEKTSSFKNVGESSKNNYKGEASKPLKTTYSSSSKYKQSERENLGNKQTDDESQAQSSRRKSENYGKTYDNRERTSHKFQKQKRHYDKKYNNNKNEKYVPKGEKDKKQKNYYKKRY